MELTEKEILILINTLEEIKSITNDILPEEEKILKKLKKSIDKN